MHHYQFRYMAQHRNWCFQIYLAGDAKFEDLVKREWEYTKNNAQHISDPNLVCEADKAHIRRRTISYTSGYKQNNVAFFYRLVSS